MKAGYSSLMNLAKQLGMDYMIHHEDSEFIVNDTGADALWALSSNNIFTWALSDPDSKFLPRQMLAAYVNTQRIVTSGAVSACDAIICACLRPFFKTTPLLSARESTQRTYTRFMTSLRRNGGVYEEIGNVIKSMFMGMSFIDDLADLRAATDSFPISLPQNRHKLRIMTVKEIQRVFESQTGAKLFETFQSVFPLPVENGFYTYYDAILKDGTKATITLIPPHRSRMRFLDSIPLRMFYAFTCFIPGISPERSLLRAVFNRATPNLKDEALYRLQILKAFGVNTALPPNKLFSSARRATSSLIIHAPIPSLVSRNVMVTDRFLRPPTKPLSASSMRSLAMGFSNAFFCHGYILSDLSPRNILAEKGRVAIKRLSPVDSFDFNIITQFKQFHSAMQTRNIESVMKSASELGISTKAAKRSYMKKQISPSLIREFYKLHANKLVALSEALTSLNYTRTESNTGYFSMMPVALGFASKYVSNTLNHHSFPFNLLLPFRYLPI